MKVDTDIIYSIKSPVGRDMILVMMYVVTYIT